MAKAKWVCAACGAVFLPDRYNSAHRKYCTGAACVLLRKRRRQREWHARKCRDDPSFREAARERCAAANRRRRQRERAEEGVNGSSGLSAPMIALLGEVLLGVVCQLTDATDRSALAESVRGCRDRGRKVAATAPADVPAG